MTDRRRALPSVDRLLRLPELATVPRALATRAVRAAIAAVRDNGTTAPADLAGWVALVDRQLNATSVPTLRRVVNATGVVIHTNFGRAPLSQDAIDAITGAASMYNTLEYDAEKGTRGSRHVHCAALLAELTGAADAMVVNNAASALLLVLAVAAEGSATVVSRGELIEIGGGFRIPEIMERSGTTLIEVGTTNRTRVADYEKAIARKPIANSHQPSAVLKVHRSNFRLEGFTAEASLEELVALGRKKKLPVLYDLGSGLLFDLGVPELSGEPTLRGVAKSGAAAVVASGDKLLGGPQAGILIGSKRFVGACRAHPLARAVRADKLTLAALAATLRAYQDPETARQTIPVLRMLTASASGLELAAEALCSALPAAARASVVTTRSAVGGGAFPGVELESRGVALDPKGVTPDALAGRLRRRACPVVGVVRKNRLTLDVRTLMGGDDAIIVAAVGEALGA